MVLVNSSSCIICTINIFKYLVLINMDEGEIVTPYMKPLELFKNKELVTICAPMVRYSKLAFRSLVRKYGCDLCFTPMIISDCFIQSIRARHSDFTTCKEDRPLVVQFAASKGEDWAQATKLVAPYCDGVDLNCGCPQRWAMAEGYGACLIHKPHLVADMIHQTRNTVTDPDFTVSIKIRLHKDYKHTVDFARQMEAAGASFITVHGRTQDQRGDPVCLEAIADIKSALQIPVVANGDVRSMDDAHRIHHVTGVDGVMAARGMLENPAMYAGYKTTPQECVKDWVNIALKTGTHFTCFHHHLIYMLEKSLSRGERKYFNILGSTSGVLTYLTEKYKMEFSRSFYINLISRECNIIGWQTVIRIVIIIWQNMIKILIIILIIICTVVINIHHISPSCFRNSAIGDNIHKDEKYELTQE